MTSETCCTSIPLAWRERRDRKNRVCVCVCVRACVCVHVCVCVWRIHTRRSVVMRTREDPDLNSFIITSLSFCSMSPCCVCARGGEFHKDASHVNFNITAHKSHDVYTYTIHVLAPRQCCESYHGRDCEVPRVHLLCQPIDFPTSVDKDDSLCDGECLVQVTQSVQLPFLWQQNTVTQQTQTFGQ